MMTDAFQARAEKILQAAVFMGREFRSPIIYLTGIAVGALVVILMGNFSLIPFIVPIVIQAVSRGSIKYSKRLESQLAMVPAMRPDPTFIMDQTGHITLSAGVTRKLFQTHDISTVSDFIEKKGAERLKTATKTCQDREVVFVAHSPVVNKHYEITSVPANTGCPADSPQFIVWFKDITPRIDLFDRQKKLLGYFNHLLENIRQISKQKNLDELLAQHILDSYSAVFIARIDNQGEISGNVFKIDNSLMQKSEPVTISSDHEAPIRLSMRQEDVVLDQASSMEELDRFHATYNFDPKVKEFIADPVTGFINYHQGDIVVIAFNPLKPFTFFEKAYFETVVSVSRSVFYLTNLARVNDEKSLQTVMGLSAAAEFSDEITGHHILRVGEYSKFLAAELGYSENYVEDIGLAAPLHDLGKVAMPELIKYNGKYDDEMRARMQMHTVIGANILGRMIRFADKPEPWLILAYNIALHHHQMYAATGYPCSTILGVQPGDLSISPDDYQDCQTVSGSQIPAEALIVGLADRYDALRSARQYKPEFGHEKAMEIMSHDDRLNISGEDWYGPELWSAFTERHQKMAEIYESMRD